MTLVDYSRQPVSLFKTALRRLGGALDRLAKAIAYSRLCTELDRLTDSELADIGITRADIPRRAWETVYGERL